jgi:hypothetical protein
VYLQSQALDRSIYLSINTSCSKSSIVHTSSSEPVVPRISVKEKGDRGGGGGGGGGKGRQLKMGMGRGRGNEYEKMTSEGSGKGREMGKTVTLERWNLVESGKPHKLRTCSLLQGQVRSGLPMGKRRKRNEMSVCSIDCLPESEEYVTRISDQIPRSVCMLIRSES